MADGKGNALVKLNDLTVTAGFEELLQENCLDSLNALFVTPDAEPLNKPGLALWRERLRLTITDRGSARTVYLKRFHKPPTRALRELRRGARGIRSLAGLEWARMRQLASDGIPCVQPIAFGEELRGSRERRSAILTAAVPGDSLERWLQRWGKDDRRTVCGLLQPLAALIARFHADGYIHRDLYLSHVFFDPNGGDSLHLIDLQRVMRPRWRRRRWIVKDLAALNYSAPPRLVSRTDRLRWLKHYLGVSKLDASAKRLAYRVAGKTQWIAGHDRRRAAGLSARDSSS